MKRTRYHLILWLLLFVISTVLLFSLSIIVGLTPDIKNAILTALFILMATSLTAFCIKYVHYLKIKMLINGDMHILAQWSCCASESSTLRKFLKEEFCSTMLTATLSFILGITLSLMIAYSGGSNVFIMGYILILFIVLIFLVALHFIRDYYEQCSIVPNTVLFGDTTIYFMGQLFSFQKSFLILEDVCINLTPEPVLQFSYGHYDLDSPPKYILSIPIPSDKMHVATYLVSHYSSMIIDDNI